MSYADINSYRTSTLFRSRILPMVDWKRIIVGDAFELSSRDWNYYRDLVLVCPFTLFSLMVFDEFFHPTDTRHYWAILAAVAVVLVLLAKEKVLLLLAPVAFIAMRSLWVFIAVRRDIRVLLAGGICSLILIVALVLGRNYRPKYQFSGTDRMLDLVVGVLSLIGTFVLKIWLDKHLA